MFFPWPGRARKRSTKALKDYASRARKPLRLQIDPLEDRRLLAVYIEAESTFYNPARPQDVTLQEGNTGVVEGVFRIALDAAEASPVTVDVRTTDGMGPAAAVAGQDYFASGMRVTFDPGVTEQFITIGAFGDSVAELDETFNVVLSSFTGAGGIIKAPGAQPSDVAGRGTVTILDDDVSFIQINDVQVIEGNAGQVNAVFTVNLSGPDPQTVTVNFATSGGTATENNDYVGTAGIVTFNPGEIIKTITVQVNGDTLDEVNETFFVNLSNSVNAQIQDPQGQATIIDDEGILVNIGDVSTTEGNSGLFKDMVFTVTLSESRPSTVNVQFRTDNVNAPPPQVIPGRVGTAPFQRLAMIAQPTLAYQSLDYIQTSGMLTFAPGVVSQNITVKVFGENVHELNETFRVLLTSVTTNGGDTINLIATEATGTIVNDDQVPQLIVHDASTQGGVNPGTGQPIVDEGDNPLLSDLFPEFTFTHFPLASEPWSRPVRINVSLSNPSSGSIAVAYSTIGETATPGVDYRRSYPNHLSAELGGPTVYFGGLQTPGSTPAAMFGDPFNDNVLNPQDIDPPFDITEYGPGQKPPTFPAGPSPTTGLPNEYAQVIFQPGDVSEDIVLRIFKEASRFHLPVAEGNETFLIRADGFSGNSAQAVIADDTGRVTIIDDDPRPSYSVGNATIVEGENGQSFLLFTVNVGNGRVELPLAVDYTTVQLAPGATSATAGVDYLTTQGTLFFNPQQPQLPPLPTIAGVTSQAFSVPILGDFLDESDELFQVVLSNPLNGTIGAGTATGTIRDNEGPTVTISSDVTVTETDSGTVNAVFNILLSTASTQDVQIAFATANSSATGGEDFTPTSGFITFTAGNSSPQPITVRVLGDTLFEGTETFLLNLTNPNPLLATIADPQGIGTILDNEQPLPAVRIEDASLVEGNLGSSNMVFRVRLVKQDGSPLTVLPNQTVGVGFFTENNSALSGQDYTGQSGNLVFNHPLGETEKFITIPVQGDTTAEANEKFLVRLTNPLNVTFFNSSAEGTIIDDDTVPSIAIAAQQAFQFEGNNLLFNVTLSHASASPITVVFSTSNNTAISGSDYTATTGTLSFAPGETVKTVTVSTLTDSPLAEPNETFLVNLSSPTNSVLSTGSATGTIVDIDSLTIIIDTPVPSLEGNNIVFPIRLSQPSPGGITVDIATAATPTTAATDPTDYTGTSGQITFAAGQSTINITIPTIGDLVDELNETFFLNLTNATGATLANNQATGTIVDDDGPTVSIADSIGLEGDSGLAFIDFTVSLSTGSQQPVTVVFSTIDGTAIDEVPLTPPNNDYFRTTGTLTFLPGEITKKIRVNVLGDTVDELDETFQVELTNAQSNGFPLIITDAQATGTITDDDGPIISAQPVTVFEGNAGGVFINFVVTLDAPSPDFVSVNYFTTNGTAIGNSDFQPVSGTITFPPGETTFVVSVQVFPDTIAEQDETFNLNFQNPTGGATIAQTPVLGTILDDDTMVSIADATVTEGDSGTQDVVLTLTLTSPRPNPVTVVFTTFDVSATGGADYNITTGTATFAANSTTAQATVQVLGDLIDEPTETFNVVLSSPVGVVLGDATGMVTITDNNDPPPVMSVNNVTVTEGTSGTVNAVFTVQLTTVSGRVITADFATADGTTPPFNAQGGLDYTAVGGTLTFNPGETVKQVTVPITTDSLVESNETFTLNLSNIQFATPLTLSGIGSITDDDAELNINSVTVTETNATVNAVFTVSLSKPSSTPVTMDFATANGTAVAGADYTSTSGTLSFAPGQLVMNVTVPVLGDVLNEDPETFTVNLTNIVGAGAIATSVGTGTILNDDPLPSLSISNAAPVTEGDSGTVNAVFTVTMTPASGRVVTVVYATSNGTATLADNDYQQTTNTLTFFAGETQKVILVPVVGDMNVESNETFFVTLSTPVNATIQTATGLGTILDDEPRISISDASVTEGDSLTAVMQFVLSLTEPAPAGGITVNFATNPGGSANQATAGTDYTSTSGTLTFAPGESTQVINVDVTGDTLAEFDETFTLVLSNPVNAMIADGQATGTILNDDPLPQISIQASSLVEGDAGSANMLFTVTLSPTSGLPASVVFNTSAGGSANLATAGTDYTTTSGTLNFAAGDTVKTITVRITGDALVESDETFLVNLSGVNNATVSGPTAIGTIIDNDAQIIIGAASGFEFASQIVFPVTLSKAVNKSVTVNFATANGGASPAIAGSDYAGTSGSLSFAPGEVSKNITVQLLNDTLNEADETFLVNLSGVVGALPSSAQAIGTILNDDPTPMVSINDVTVVEGNSGTTNAVFAVSLLDQVTSQPQPSGQVVTVSFNTSDGSAVAGADYLPVGGVLTFSPGQTVQFVTVPVVGDVAVESNETFAVNLNNTSNASIGKGVGIGTIEDNELSNLIMTGAGAGGGPHVRAFKSETLEDSFSFFAYGTNFAGGVRVASADVNGDGRADMITGAGIGGGPHVRIFDGRTGQVVKGWFAFEPNITGGLYVAAGDTNLDGRAEVFVSADGNGSGGRVQVYDALSGTLLRTIVVPAAGFTTGIRVAAGDVNGDGRADIIVGSARNNTPRVMVLDATSGGVIADFFAYNPAFLGGIFVAAADVNNDGRADIITGPDTGGGPHVRIFDAVSRQEIRSFFAYSPGFGGGVRVATTDVNGDGIIDIVTGAGPGGGPHVRMFRSDTVQPIGGFFAYHPNFTGGVYVAGSLKRPGNPLMSEGHGDGDALASLTSAQLQPLVNQAVANWTALRPDAAARLRGMNVQVADLPDGYLGMAFANSIYVDVNADGHGWFVDTTPGDNNEFDLVGSALQARSGGPAANKIDLLSVIAHELGHALGLDDLDDDHDDLMAEVLSLGVRRRPGDAVDAVFGSDNW